MHNPLKMCHQHQRVTSSHIASAYPSYACVRVCVTALYGTGVTRCDSCDSVSGMHSGASRLGPPLPGALRGRGTSIQIALQKFWEMDLDDKYR